MASIDSVLAKPAPRPQHTQAPGGYLYTFPVIGTVELELALTPAEFNLVHRVGPRRRRKVFVGPYPITRIELYEADGLYLMTIGYNLSSVDQSGHNPHQLAAQLATQTLAVVQAGLSQLAT